MRLAQSNSAIMATVKISYGDELRRFRLGTAGNHWPELQRNAKSLFNLPDDAPLTLKYADSDGDIVTVSSDVELAEAIRDVAITSSPLRLTLSTTAMPKGELQEPQIQSDHNGDDKGKSSATVTVDSTTSTTSRKNIPVQIGADETANQPQETTSETTAESNPSDADPLHEMQQLLEEFMPRLLGEVLGEPRANNESTADPSEPQQQAPEPKDAHWGVECDSCHSTVVGNRYKCQTCPNFDLCEDCYQRDSAAQAGHEATHVFANIPHPLSFLPPSSAEFAQRFGGLLPGMLRSRCGRPRGCGAQSAHPHRRPHYMYSSMGPAYFYM